MASNLTRDTALMLLANTLPTGAILMVLITALGPISGAHFNPAVTLVMTLKGGMSRQQALAYVAAQFAGGMAGTILAHAMFELPLLQISQTPRTGQGQWLAEMVATFGLITTILAVLRTRPQAVPQLVALYITSAYWFTASTSFANPAVAAARTLTDSFAGIRPADLPGFVLAQIAGALLALGLCNYLYPQGETA